MSAIFDTHALVYAGDTARYSLAADIAPNEFAACTRADRLHDELENGTLAGAVLVQRNRFYGYDNALICDLAAADGRLRALVSLDTRAPGAGDEARRLLALPGVAGVRLMEPEKGADLGWLAGDVAREVWTAAAEADALVDVHLFPWCRAEGLERLTRLLTEFPEIEVLLDNLGNGAVEEGAPDYGLDTALAPLLECRRVSFKFSEMTLGRIERAGLDPAQAVDAVAARVGRERLLWGSDLLPPGLLLSEAAVRARAACRDDAILSGNAARLFGLV